MLNLFFSAIRHPGIPSITTDALTGLSLTTINYLDGLC